MRSVIVVLAVAGCGGSPARPDAADVDSTTPDATEPRYVPGPALALSASAGDDEDPAVLAARDGSLYVAWFSTAAGRRVVIARTVDGTTWSPPVPIATDPAGGADFGPSLYQAADGVIHAVWFRWPAGTTPPGHLMHARSAPDDGLTWAAAAAVTAPGGTDDWVPAVAGDPDGGMIVAFARNTCPPPGSCYGVYATASPDGAAWTDPAPIVLAGAGVEHHLPALVVAGGELHLAWTAFDAGAGPPWSGYATGAHVRTARRVAGAWAPLGDVTPRSVAAVTLFPAAYLDHAGAARVAWLAADAAAQRVLDAPLATPAPAPRALPITGYSPKLVATVTPGVYLAAWVDGPPGAREIAVRLFAP